MTVLRETEYVYALRLQKNCVRAPCTKMLVAELFVCARMYVCVRAREREVGERERWERERLTECQSSGK